MKEIISKQNNHRGIDDQRLAGDVVAEKQDQNQRSLIFCGRMVTYSNHPRRELPSCSFV